MIYLDNNSTTPVDPFVVEAMFEALKKFPGNPSSQHQFGREARQALSRARQTIANYCQVSEQEIIFTSGGTEALNLILRGILAETPGHAITSNAEHACVYNTLKEYDTTFLPAGEYGAVTPQAVQQAIRPNTKLISLMAVNNETGVKTDIHAIAAIAEQAHIPFVVDGVAWIGKEPLSIPLGVTAIAFSGHKFHAPKGVGFAVIRRGTKLKLPLAGGGQEFGRRHGTENLPGIIALAKAVELIEITPQMQQLRDYFESLLAPHITVNGKGPRISNTSNLSFPIDGETLLLSLDMKGVAVGHGSACSSGALEPSRVLLNMGLSHARARSSIRFSLSRYTTIEDIEKTVNILRSLLK